ncbi:hypothetical protein F2Q70_00007666 [Brassica cretica]|uniref:tRNA dimethylallyltransferase 9 n=1 Tax=Brassica cretica TaxID=69181 RepID=A0A8S9M7Q0_BRACR|nr:hypothetical protein F2Q70_00007666 [Brassica cretica]
MPDRRRGGSVSADAGEHQRAAFAKGEDFEIGGRRGVIGDLRDQGFEGFEGGGRFGDIVRDESVVRRDKWRVTDLGSVRSIDFRCEDMLSGADGVLSEARWLLDLGLLPNTSSATRAIGYRQAMEYLSKCRQQGGVSSPGEFYWFLNKFQQVSRNFAKRQMTWFRCEPMYHWLNASKPLDTILEFIYDAYEKEAETLVVPDSIRMNKEMRNSREANALKAYRPRNRHFVGREDCSSVLEWIRSEGCKSEVSCVEGAAM